MAGESEEGAREAPAPRKDKEEGGMIDSCNAKEDTAAAEALADGTAAAEALRTMQPSGRWR